MKCVAGLVQESAHVVVDPHGVHEDQRLFAERQGLAETAGRLALAVVQVEKPGVVHRFEVIVEVGVDVGENAGGAIDVRAHVLERLEGRPPGRVHSQVPRTQRLDAHPPAPSFVDAVDRRKHRLFNRDVKSHAVLWRVVEAVLIAMREVAKVGEACVRGDLLPEVIHTIEDAREHVTLLDEGLRAKLESALAYLAVDGLEEGQQLRGRLFFAFPRHRHRAVDLDPMRGQL